MWLNSRICESGCNKNTTAYPRYDERKSKNIGLWDYVDDFHYGRGSTYGYTWWDDVCVNNQTCLPSHSFMNVGLSTNMGEMSGLIGFCPIQDRYWAEYDLFMNSMY
jgi:hypothetical protein